MPNSVLLQDHTTLFTPASKVLVPCVALVLTWLVSILLASRPAIELPRVRTRSAKACRRSRQPESTTLLLSGRSAPSGKRNFSLHPWLEALRKRSILYVVWTAMANLMILHRTRSRRLPQAYGLHKQDFDGPISLRSSKVLGPISHHRIADILPHMKHASRASRPGIAVGFLRILCNGLCTAERFHSEGDEQTCPVG